MGLLVGTCLADFCGHAYYRMTSREFLWADRRRDAVFEIWPIAELVDDERGATLKRAFRFGPHETDTNRFRTGLGAYGSDRKNIVFLGDSVPFGWGAEASSTMPSHFARLLEQSGKSEVGVINAAVPGYTLYQAVKRFELEVDGRYPILSVVLQTWDPASQLARNGKSWTRQLTWKTANQEPTVREYREARRKPWFRYSSLLYYGYLARYKAKASALALSGNDDETKNRFVTDNLAALAELSRRLQMRGASLYLVPANPTSGVDRQPLAMATALRWLNESLSIHARRNQRTHFVEILRVFDGAGRDKLFLDDCCHLSDAGAALEAKTIHEAMQQNGDLP